MKVYVLMRETESYDGSWGASSTYSSSSELIDVYQSLDSCRKTIEKIAIADGTYAYDDYDKNAIFEWDDKKMRYSARSEYRGTGFGGIEYCDYTKTFYSIYERDLI